MNNDVSLTVLLATHNGAGTLRRVLDTYQAVAAPPGGWRVVVVDNASDDETPQLLAHFKNLLPLLPLRTEQRGKNVALNFGLTHLQGDLVVLTDDDALPEPDWLLALQGSAAAHPAFDVFGGHIDAIWPADTPEWIPRLVNLGATFAVTPPGIAEGPIEAAQVWGPNMAVRRKVFDAGHRFNEAVGPQAGQYIMGSEVEFTCRVEKAGHSAWFAANARVGHIIRPKQIERQWIIDRAFRLGRHMFHRELESLKPGTPMLRGAPRWKFRLLLREHVSRMLALLTGNSDRRFLADWEISFLKGYLSEARRRD